MAASGSSPGIPSAATGGGPPVGSADTRPAWPDHPRRTRRYLQAQPGLADSRGRTPSVKNTGELCAAEAHARFEVDGAAMATGHGGARAGQVDRYDTTT